MQQPNNVLESIDFTKISTTNTNGLLKEFSNLVKNLEFELDNMFKNYNRLIKEAKNKIDIQIKATKKEKMRHFQYFAKEEILFWENFPRKNKFYNQGLAEIRQLLIQEKWNDQETRDLDHVVQAVMDLLPQCSQKYCQIFSFNSEYMKKPQKEALLTFDKITENLRMFDSNDTRNWQILAYTVTILVSDVLSILLDPSNKGAPIYIGTETTAALILQQAKLYSKRLLKQAEDEENSVETNIVQKLYAQIQSTWESQIFHYLSRSSRQNFDLCLRFILSALYNDHNKFDAAQIADFIQQIYFGRYLAIAPTDLEMGAKVLQLLDKFLQMLNEKVGSFFKEGLLSTLRHLTEFLWFGDDYSIQNLSFDSEAMKILWASISKLYVIVDKIADKKEKLREQAHLLMAQILKISTDDFLDQNLQKFLTKIKFQTFFQQKKESQNDKETLRELKLVNQLIIGGNTYSQAFKVWRPRTIKFYLCLNEDKTKIYTPLEYWQAPLTHVRLQRKIQENQYLVNIFNNYELIFSPKSGLSQLDYQHWQLLEQLTYDDLQFVVQKIFPLLLSCRLQENGIEYLNMGLKLCKYILDPSIGFQQRYIVLQPQEQNNLANLVKEVQDLSAQAIKEILEKNLHLKSNFIYNCLNSFKIPQFFQQTEQIGSWTMVSSARTSATLRQKFKKQGQFYLQNKVRTVTFDDMNELQRLDFTYDNEVINQIHTNLKKSSKTDRAKEGYVRYRYQCQLSQIDQLERFQQQQQQIQTQQYPELSNLKSESLRLLKLILEIMPNIDLEKECILFMPSYDSTMRGNLIEKARQNLGFSCQQISSEQNQFLSECERLYPTYLLLSLDSEIQQKAQKCILKMMVSASVQAKIALIDQMCYLIKEIMFHVESKVLKTLQFCLMNSIKVWLWCERSRFTISDPQATLEIPIIKTKQSDITFIYKYLHIFRMADMIALVGMCNKDIDVRQASVITLIDLGKLKRLIVKKDLITPLFDDLLYQNQTKLQREILLKMNLLNGLRNMQILNEDQLSQITFYQLMIDNFEYQKFGLQEHQIRDLQVIYLGDLLRTYKRELLKETDWKTEHVRDVGGGPILNMLQILSQKTLSQFESHLSKDTAEQEKDNVGFNLLCAIVMSNITKSHQKINKYVKDSHQPDQDYDQEILTSGESISTNTILEETRNLVAIIETNLGQMHKMPFGRFQPARIWTSNVILSFIYYLQEDFSNQSKSLDNLYEVFIIKRVSFDSKLDFAVNCVLFYTILSMESTLQKYIEQQPSNLNQLAVILEMLNQVEIPDDSLLKKQTILKVVLIYNICNFIKLQTQSNSKFTSTSILSQEMQTNIMKFTRDQEQSWEKSPDLNWLMPIVKQIWYSIIGFQSSLPESSDMISLDLKFLIQLEQEGFQGSLNFYRSQKVTSKRRNETQDQQRINEIKTLIQYVYAFTPSKPRDQGTLVQKPTSMIQKNVYFKCLINLIDTTQLNKMLDSSPFEEIYQNLAKNLIGSKTDKLIKAGLIPKLFLVCLFMTVNSIDKSFIERARIICLATLPLMFTELIYRQQVQQMIQKSVISQLVDFESKQFYQFIKIVFKNEEKFNMEHHFEKYFSLSGFLRDLLNEIIKLQSSSEAPLVQPRMLLKVLDMITYFFSGISLRRSPITEDDSFIFANLIDFKSFEFLSKLYKISEKLVDFDTENMSVMNMWFKVCEGRESNFEVLGKFLIHNLSSFILKVQLDKQKVDKQDVSNMTNEQEFEKHKRYSLSIFNYIKARTQQMDVRQSIEINGQTWSQKMLKVVLKTRLNLTSKYTLEKIKLKKVLELLHGEINQSDLKLKLRGGLENVVNLLGDKGDVRQSISMSQLIQSQTFLETFSQKRQNNKATLKQLIFVLDRQMYEKFIELTPEIQIDRMPDLLIRYFENTLILIANEAERLQIIKFTPKEEIIVAVLLLTLVADLALKKSPQESNRAYFIYDLVYKLSGSVYGVQKYLKQISVDQFCELQTEQDILSFFNSRQSFDNFPLFTSIWFKILNNITLMPKLYYFMLNIWYQTLLKHHSVISKEASHQILFGRQQVLQILKTCFSIIHLMTKPLKNGEMQLHLKNFVQTFECLIELVQPQAKHQANFSNFNTQSSCDIAYGTNSIYWLAFACMIDQPFQQVGVTIMRRIMEDSEFYKLLLGLQNIPKTFSSLKLSQIKRSFLDVLFNNVCHKKASDEAFKCLIVTIKAQDSLLICNPEQLAKEELHRFLLLLPYLMSQFTIQDVNQSVAVFSNKRSIIQLLKKSLPSISISNKNKILQILDVIQRKVDQDDQVLVHEQFQMLIEAVKDQLLQQQEFGLQVIQQCKESLKLMIQNKVDSVNIKILQDCLQRISIENLNNLESKQKPSDLQNQILNEETSAISEELRTLYFSLKHIIIEEIEQSSQNIDCQLYFTGEESNPSQKVILHRRQSISDTQKNLQKNASIEQQDLYKLQQKILPNKNVFTKKQEMVSKYQNSNSASNKQSQNIQNQIIQRCDSNQRQEERSASEFKLSPSNLKQSQINQQKSSQKNLKVFDETSDDEVQLLGPIQGGIQNLNEQLHTHGSMLGTFAKERELEPDQMEISQQISSISGISIGQKSEKTVSGNIQNQRISSVSTGKPQTQDFDIRPQTGQFQNEFDFQIEHPGHNIQFRQTQPVQKKSESLQQPDKAKVIVDLQTNNWLKQQNTSSISSQLSQQPKSTIKQRNNFDRQLKMIANDDDVLFDLEQHLTKNSVDLDQLAFYIKVLDFKSESSNRNIIAGLILDNYLSEEAEFYIGDSFSDSVINKLIDDFKRAIQVDQAVDINLFDDCCQVVRSNIEKYITSFMEEGNQN